MERNEMSDIAKVGVINSSVLGMVTFAEAESALKIVLLVVTIGYTGYKFYLTARRESNETHWHKWRKKKL